MRKKYVIFTMVALVLSAQYLGADEVSAKKSSEWIIQPDKLKTTQHYLQVGEEKISYTATTGPLDLHDEKGSVTAQIFFIAYTKNDPEINRPITFCFNGGPGSSSVWLHLGAFGPKKAITPQEGQSIAPPYRWVDNQNTILDLTDLVFIDPVGTGFSVPSEESGDKFYEVEADIASVGDFIRDYITYFKRWLSPKYLAGESYGTTRAAGLSEYLQTNNGIYLNGMVLVSSAMDFLTFPWFQDNYLGYVLTLPSYTTAAWYHKKLPVGYSSLEEAVAASKHFSYHEYGDFLFKGGTPSDEEKRQMAESLSKFTGLPPELILRKKLKIDLDVFTSELLPGKTIGNYDSRVEGDYTQVSRTSFQEDPSATSIEGIMTGVINAYLRQELEYDGGFSPYKVLNIEANMKWNYSVNSPFQLNMMESIRRGMVVNPSFKIFVASGLFDLVTTFSATEFSFAHLGLPDKFYKNVKVINYLGGHMMYLDPSVHEKLKADLVTFYKSAY